MNVEVKHILKPGLHWLYLFIPAAIGLDYGHASPPLIFFSAALSIIPVSLLIGTSTEQLTPYTGEAAGGLLTATFGNFPELVIGIIALKAGLHDMLLATMAGAILANLLLVMGVSFLVGGIKFHNLEYSPASIRVYSSMMMVAIISLMVPAAFHRLSANETISENEYALNVGLSITLLIAYALYLVFMLITHPDFFRNTDNKTEEEKKNQWSLKRALIALLISSLGVAFLSEILVGAAEETGKVLGMTPVFIGVIFLAIVGAAGNIPAVAMAAKGKMDLSIGIVLGSSIQISLFVAPVLVLASLVVGPGQLTLSFSRVLIIIIFLSVLLGAIVAGDGRSNWYKGVQLIIMYVIIAMLFFFVPAIS